MEVIDVKKSRFRDADWFGRLNSMEISPIIGGVGGIGSWVALLLARMLNSRKHMMVLYDPDNVEEVNMAGQLYLVKQVRQLKVDATIQVVKDFTGFDNFHAATEKYDKDSLRSPVMFSCFDNMKARKDMFGNWKKEAKLNADSIFIDGRLLAEQFQVFFVTPDRIERYEKYLFDDKEVEETSCSYKQTSHFAASIAAKMIQGFTNWLTGGNAEVPFYYEEFGPLFITGTKDE